MSHPITCGHCDKGKPYDGPYDISRQCRLCWLYHNDPAYREFWGGAPQPEKVIPCKHKGRRAGAEQCGSCKGTVQLFVWDCAVHGRCHEAPGKVLPGVHACVGCSEGPVTIVANASGVGDALLGLCAAAGLKGTSPRREVVYEVCQPWQEEWCKLFTGYDRLVLGQRPTATGVRRLMQFGEAEAADPTLKRKSRWEYYAEAAGAPCAVVPPARPLPPDALLRAAPHRGAVILSPYSAWPGRAWPPDRWVELETALAGIGRRCVVLDGFGGEAKDAGFASPVLGYDPPGVAALLQAAPLFVGNDSGMAHAAGMFRTPALVLSWFYSGYNTYGLYGNTRVIQAQAWRESITVEMVLREAVKRLAEVSPS